MSGPKVIRIVTREELIAICEGHLARVNAELAEWIRVGRRNDSITEAEVAAAEGRRDKIRELLAADRFAEVQKQAPREVAFLRSDQQARLGKVAAEAAKARAAGRRQQEAAQALLAALRNAGKRLDPKLEQALDRAAAGHSNPRAMSEGFALLSSEPDEQAAGLRDLAERLKDGKDRLTLDDWLAQQPKAAADPKIELLEARLAELSVLAGVEAGAPLEGRLRAVMTEPSDERSRLLLDSLELDLGRTLVDARKRVALKDEIRLSFAELAGSSALPGLVSRLQTAASAAVLAGLLTEAKQVLARERDKLNAKARRAAVLKGLAGLGYEVTEGLSTAWVEQGCVVLRKPAQPGYGVEIFDNLGTARMQMRVVAFTDGVTGPDPARDKDAETLWCSDVAALKTLVAEAGGDVVIERARAVGAIPVKRLVAPALADRRLEGWDAKPPIARQS